MESDKALEALKRAKAADPLFCFADYAMGLAYEQKGALELAISSLTNAVTPPSPVCQNNQEAFLVRGRVYARMQNKAAACADFTKCLSFASTAMPTTAARECGRLQVEQSC
jgi:tetratricopeptide (TPR) repeat protein